ncbi:MAG: FAD-binding monooxygenase [Betaproteobacteria bacterium]|nr:FAD-binding monooxygenase [Betaproteobacteria bacterium]
MTQVQWSASGYTLPQYTFVPPPELADGSVRRYPIVIAGGGLAGLTLACDLASRGVACVLLDEDDTVGVRGASSRGIVYAQKSLEIFARLGIYEQIRAKGVTWSVGRTFDGDREVYSFNRQLASASLQPPFINIQQFYIEAFLVERIQTLGCADLRWRNMVTGVEQRDDHVRLMVETPAGAYELEAQWLIDATGANSPIRDALGLDAHASRSPDRWCITDVRFKKSFPAERWTWIRAPFNDGRAVWQHLMADNVWRVDFQMGQDADPEYVSRPDVAAQRLRAYLGEDLEFEFVWIGPYQYRDHLLDEFKVWRVFFIGDSAHVVSPFGARGGNSGIQDAANLAWKLALVQSGEADERLLDSYHDERRAAAVENLQVARRTARFLASLSPAEKLFRQAVLDLAREHAFARALVDTGRMSVANAYPVSRHLPQGARSVPNLPLPGGQALVDLFKEGTRFTAIAFGEAVVINHPLVKVYHCARDEMEKVWAAELRCVKGSVALLRPDGYLAGVWNTADMAGIYDCLPRARREAR